MKQKRIREELIKTAPYGIRNPAHGADDILSRMKTSSTEGRQGIKTSTAGRNGGTK